MRRGAEGEGGGLSIVNASTVDTIAVWHLKLEQGEANRHTYTHGRVFTHENPYKDTWN